MKRPRLSAQRLGGLLDESGHGFRVRYVHGVATLLFNNLRACALRHETLGCGWNHLVLRRHEIPARLGFPCRLTDGARERLDAPWDLGVGHEGCLLRVDVAGERL